VLGNKRFQRGYAVRALNVHVEHEDARNAAASHRDVGVRVGSPEDTDAISGLLCGVAAPLD
jgi:hypothetical protein